MKTEDALFRASVAMRFPILTFLAGTVLASVIAMNGLLSRAVLPSMTASFSPRRASMWERPMRQRNRAARGRRQQRPHSSSTSAKTQDVSLHRGRVAGRPQEEWATFASSKAGRLKSRARSRTTTDARRSSCAAPSNWAKSAFSWFPAVPTDYDVERRGHYSAGRSKPYKEKKHRQKKQGKPVSIEDPGEPQ